MKRRFLAILCVAVLGTGLVAGCGSSEEESTKTETTREEKEETPKEEAASDASEEEPEVDNTETAAATEEEIKEAMSEEEAEKAGFTDGEEKPEETVLDTTVPLSGKHHAEIVIRDYGTVEVELDADKAPLTVTNFVKLVQDDFYDGLTFHRIMDGFMMQGGDPLGNGTGGSDETVKGEFPNNGVDNDISHVRGTISMARASDPDSASSQFFIVQADSTFLDGDYAGFGTVTAGMDVVDKICKEAEPTDDNGTIRSEEQPVMENVHMID